MGPTLHSAHKISTAGFDSALSEYGLSNAWKSAGTALAEKLRVCPGTRTPQEPVVLTHVFKRIALFTAGICARQIIGQKVFSATELVYTSVQINSGICVTWPPHAIVKACKNRCRKVEMCLG